MLKTSIAIKEGTEEDSGGQFKIEFCSNLEAWQKQKFIYQRSVSLMQSNICSTLMMIKICLVTFEQEIFMKSKE